VGVKVGVGVEAEKVRGKTVELWGGRGVGGGPSFVPLIRSSVPHFLTHLYMLCSGRMHMLQDSASPPLSSLSYSIVVSLQAAMAGPAVGVAAAGRCGWLAVVSVGFV
jgi:hypothetical protein